MNLIVMTCFLAAISGKVMTHECVDTPHWKSPHGDDCNAYRNGVCENDGIKLGKEWAFGETFNYPERNCCGCGKAVGGECEWDGDCKDANKPRCVYEEPEDGGSYCGCDVADFECDNRNCVPFETFSCDGVNDCGDFSDEVYSKCGYAWGQTTGEEEYTLTTVDSLCSGSPGNITVDTLKGCQHAVGSIMAIFPNASNYVLTEQEPGYPKGCYVYDNGGEQNIYYNDVEPEDGASEPHSMAVCILVCGEDEVKCKSDGSGGTNGGCIPKSWLCDGEMDCWDNSDEEHCNTPTTTTVATTTHEMDPYHYHQKCWMTDDCPHDYICDDGWCSYVYLLPGQIDHWYGPNMGVKHGTSDPKDPKQDPNMGS